MCILDMRCQRMEESSGEGAKRGCEERVSLAAAARRTRALPHNRSRRGQHGQRGHLRRWRQRNRERAPNAMGTETQREGT